VGFFERGTISKRELELELRKRVVEKEDWHASQGGDRHTSQGDFNIKYRELSYNN
jgi:hypothetical protein